VKDEHLRDEHVKDAAQDVADDVTQDVAKGVLGAAEDGSAKISSWHASSSTALHAALGRHVKDKHVKDEAQDVAKGVVEDVSQDVAQEVAQDLVVGARAARALLATPPPPPLPSWCSSR